MLLTKFRKFRARHTTREIMAHVVLAGVALVIGGVMYALVPWALMQDPNYGINDLWIYYGMMLGVPAVILGLVWGLHNLD